MFSLTYLPHQAAIHNAYYNDIINGANTVVAFSRTESPMTMSSREIAELTGKEHKNVIRDIRTMLADLGDGSDLSHVVETHDARGYTDCFNLPKDLTITLVSGYNVQMRYAITRRWMELEAQQAPSLPQTFAEALRLAADKEEQRLALAHQVEVMKPAAQVGSVVGKRKNMTTKTNIITRDYNGQTFRFREDGYFNMTKAAQAFGKQLSNFWLSPSTTEYMEALAKTLDSKELVDAKRGKYGGTWGHPKLAVFFARWLDVKFAVFCDMVIDDILNKKIEAVVVKPAEAISPKLAPTHLDTARELVAALEQTERLAQPQHLQLQRPADSRSRDRWPALVRGCRYLQSDWIPSQS